MLYDKLLHIRVDEVTQPVSDKAKNGMRFIGLPNVYSSEHTDVSQDFILFSAC